MSAQQIVVFLVTLSILVVLHEYGHFLVARRAGVRVTDFAVGLWQTLLKWTSPRSGTNYRINALPLGGYCQMKGEDGKSSEAQQQRQFRTSETYDHDNFQAKSPLTRLLIVAAGPVANFIVALVLLFVGALTFGSPGHGSTTTIFGRQPDSPAARAGLRSGDRIVSIDGLAMQNGDSMVKLINGSLGKQLVVVYERNAERHAVKVTPRADIGPNGKPIGRLGFMPLPMSQRVGLAEAWSSSWGYFSNVVVGTMGARSEE